jgi:AmmeMemoRadiSam system protein B
MLHGYVIRAPAVAGLFYPDDRRELLEMVRGFMSGPAISLPAPKALIAPHAGFLYSGPIAGAAFAQLQNVRDAITRVVLAGPSHRVAFPGIALSSARTFQTPLGPVPVDYEAVAGIADLPDVTLLDHAHAQEHSLETHLPFLQVALKNFSIVPLVVGDATPDAIAAVFEQLWGGPETLICVSSDLSHYHRYDQAQHMDAATSRAIESLDARSIDAQHACGWLPVRGLIQAARKHGLKARALDVRNSGDTAGSHDQVVGYGAYAFA